MSIICAVNNFDLCFLIIINNCHLPSRRSQESASLHFETVRPNITSFKQTFKLIKIQSWDAAWAHKPLTHQVAALLRTAGVVKTKTHMTAEIDHLHHGPATEIPQVNKTSREDQLDKTIQLAWESHTYKTHRLKSSTTTKPKDKASKRL